MKRKKVLHFIESGGLYGAESVILNISREMIVHGEYAPIIGCIVQSKSEENDLYSKSAQLGIPSIKIRLRNGFLWVDMPRAIRVLKDLTISAIHCHGYKAFVFAFFIAKFLNIPVISTCHLWFLKGNPPLKMRAMISLEIFLYKFQNRVVCVSEPIKRILLNAGVKSQKVEVINNGVYIEDYQLTDHVCMTRLRTELGIQPDDFVVVNAGRLSLQKSQRTILAAARQLQEENERFRFLIVGEGELHSELEKSISDNNLNSSIKLLGFRPDVNELLAIADAFVLTSIDEGMPMILLEAVASKTPIITTMVGDIPKLIRHETSGIAIPVNNSSALAEALIRLRADPEKGLRLSSAALEKLQNEYSSKNMFKQYGKVYRKVSKNSKGNLVPLNTGDLTNLPIA